MTDHGIIDAMRRSAHILLDMAFAVALPNRISEEDALRMSKQRKGDRVRRR